MTNTSAQLKRRGEILAAAQQVLFGQAQGKNKLSLTAVSQKLGLTHAALYRHFENKDDLWLSLAQHWLTASEEDLAALLANSTANPVDQLHEWLLHLTASKQLTYQEHPELFRLYTDLVAKNAAIEQKHLQVLKSQLMHIFHVTASDQAGIARMQAILDAFTFFYDPRYKEQWQDPEIRSRQEHVWQLLVGQIQDYQSQSQ